MQGYKKKNIAASDKSESGFTIKSESVFDVTGKFHNIQMINRGKDSIDRYAVRRDGKMIFFCINESDVEAFWEKEIQAFRKEYSNECSN